MITREEVEAAQASWARMILAIGEADTWEAAKELATSLVGDHYHVEDAGLLFCPTRACDQPCRSTLAATVSYFVGGHADHDEDEGFALEGWTAIRFDNVGVDCRGDVAMAMGTYLFSRADGSDLRAEYSFVYTRSALGDLKIRLHHSALPFQR